MSEGGGSVNGLDGSVWVGVGVASLMGALVGLDVCVRGSVGMGESVGLSVGAEVGVGVWVDSSVGAACIGMYVRGGGGVVTVMLKGVMRG
jgi:hypothetical protein